MPLPAQVLEKTTITQQMGKPQIASPMKEIDTNATRKMNIAPSRLSLMALSGALTTMSVVAAPIVA